MADDFKSLAVKKAKFKKEHVPPFKITSVYGKAFRRGLDNLDISSVLEVLGKEILKRVRDQIRQSAFSDAAKKRLSKAVSIKLLPSSLAIVAKDPLWAYLVDGRRKHQMTWLVKARAPIPIVTETGEVIFRSATAKSMKNGSWVFPGRPALNIMDRAKKEAKAIARKKLGKEIVRQLER